MNIWKSLENGSFSSTHPLLIPFFIFVFPFALRAEALNLRVGGGMVDYQFEGAGSSPNYLWESKPTYPAEPYLEFEVNSLMNSVGAYKRAELEYIGGHRVQEKPQPVARQVSTWVTYFGWGWKMKNGFSFEIGPMAVGQFHSLSDPAGVEKLHKETLRLGSYFGAFYSQGFGPWDLNVGSSIGVLGYPQRQSAVSEIELGFNRLLGQGPWSMGLKVKTGLIQLVRSQSLIGSLGSASDAILLFRQGETDTKILLLNVMRKI